MTITLVIPPSGFLLDERVFPSLGILKVARSLELAGHAVDVLDLSGVDSVESAVEQHVRTVDADVYGITATMPQMPSAAKIARQLRVQSNAKLILGGPQVTMLVASQRQEQKRKIVSRATKAVAQLFTLFDVLVAGDGEYAIHHALTLDRGLIDADDPTSTLWLTTNDLEHAPLAARHLIDLDSYHYEIDGAPAHSIIGQLGCPFGCNFCGGRRSPFLRRVRLRSAQSVVSEIYSLYQNYGTRGVMFLDDELNVNPSFVELLEQIIELKERTHIDFRFRGLVKSELLTEQQAELMYRAGFRELLIGFESGSPRMLDNMNKHATVDDNTRCVAICKRHGIRVKALMSLGHPGESEQTVRETGDWLRRVRPDNFDVTIITVYPGTPYYDDAVEQQGFWVYTAQKTKDRLYALDCDQLTDVNFYKGLPGHYQSFVSTDFLTADELCAHRDELERTIRAELAIPYPQSYSEQHFEHSMGAR